jgi:hypothetical protein
MKQRERPPSPPFGRLRRGRHTRWFIVVAFVVGMAWVEAASVYYLRALVGRIEPYQENPPQNEPPRKNPRLRFQPEQVPSGKQKGKCKNSVPKGKRVPQRIPFPSAGPKSHTSKDQPAGPHHKSRIRNYSSEMTWLHWGADCGAMAMRVGRAAIRRIRDQSPQVRRSAGTPPPTSTMTIS